MWSRALTQEEIVEHMSVPLEKAPHLLARWGLEAIENHVFVDSTGNEHYGAAQDVTLDFGDMAPLAGGVCVYASP